MKKIIYATLAAAAILSSGCEKEETGSVPSIKCEKSIFIDADQTDVQFAYTIENPSSAALVAESDASWLEITGTEDGIVSARAEENTEDTPRTARITLSYERAADVTVAIQQRSAVSSDELSFSIEFTHIGSREVIVNCIPSDLNATYIAMAIEKEDFDSFSSEQELFEDNIEYFIEWGAAFGATSEEEAIMMFIRKGTMLDYDITVSKPMSDYYFYAYGMEPDGTVTSRIYKEEFTTIAPEQEDCRFEFSIRPSFDCTRISVRPSSIYVQYYWSVMEADEFKTYGNDAAKIIADVKADAESKGETLGDVLVYHNKNTNFTGLQDGKEYVVFAFGCDVTGFPTTEIMSKEFTAETLQKSSCGFTLTKDNTRATSFAYRITPDDPDTRWIAYTLPYEIAEEAASPEAVTDEVLDIFYSLGIDWSTDNEYVHSGEQTLTSYDMGGGELAPESRHYVAVLAVSSYGTRLSDITETSIMTVPAGTPSDMTIEIDTEVSADNYVTVTFTPSSKEIFFFDIVPETLYHEYGSDKEFINGLLSYYASNQLLPHKLSYDRASMETGGLEPDTEYMAVAFGYDATVSTGLFKKRFSTGPGVSARATGTSVEKHFMEIPVLSEIISGKEHIPMR